MMRKYQKGGKIYSYNKGSHYEPNTNNIYFNKEDDKSNPNAVLEHELYHRFQNENNGLQLPEYYNGPLKRPNMLMNDDYQSAYYNRKGIDEQNMYNKMIAKNPDWQFIPRDLLYTGYKTSSGNYVPGINDIMYEDPTTAEGEARAYENYIRKGGKTMFPNQTINEYKSGGKWIQGAIKNPGRCTPGSPNYDCPEGSPQWRLAQTFKKHHGFHKKESLKEYQRGGPTASDSLAVMNTQIALNKFYDNEVRKGNLTKNKPRRFVNFNESRWLNDDNLDFYRTEIKNREENKKKGTSNNWDEYYKKYFNLNPSDVSKLEYQGIGKTKSSDANRQYYRDLITPYQNLAAPFALMDTRIKPQYIIDYKPTYALYPGGAISVYDYDPIVVKPAAMKTAADYEYVRKHYPELYKKPGAISVPSTGGRYVKTGPRTLSLLKENSFDPLQSLRNTAPDYNQMLADLQTKQPEAQYQTPSRTLPLNGNEPPVDNGRILYYNYGTPEKEVIENPENYTTPFKRYQEGGPFISNSKKINLNLPVYRKPEMKPLQFNKFFVNDKNQNLYIGGVNPRYQNKDFSVGPYMVGVGNTNFQKFPADMGMSGTYHVNDNFDINMGVGQNNVGAGIKYKFAKGGIPNNPGFNALPKYVQKRIINNSSRNNYKQGGSVTLNAGGEKHRIYVKTTNRGEGAKGHIMVNHPTMNKGMWDTIDLTQKAGVKTIAQGVASTKKWHKENPYDMKNKKYQQGGIPYNNLDDVLKKLFG
jgi:hypothetical protein